MREQLQDALIQQSLRQRALLVGEVTDAKAALLFIGQDCDTDFEKRTQEECAALGIEPGSVGADYSTRVDCRQSRLCRSAGTPPQCVTSDVVPHESAHTKGI
jgi:hypothetical protein